MFSDMRPEALVPPDHALRAIRLLMNRALERLPVEFDKLSARGGRDSIAPEKPLLSSEHVSVDGTLIEAWASMQSFRPKDGSGPPPGPGRNGERDFHGEKRSNETHASTTDPDARLARKSNGQASRLCYAGHVVMENRHDLAVAAMTTRAAGTAERAAGEAMMAGLDRAARSTLAADKNDDTRDFVAAMRGMGVIRPAATPDVSRTPGWWAAACQNKDIPAAAPQLQRSKQAAAGMTPHVAQHTNGRRSAIDGRMTRHSKLMAAPA